MKKISGLNFQPTLYFLFFIIWRYSAEDMATSSNAYQAQGDRTMVYVYLISILAVLGVYWISRRRIKMFRPSWIILSIALWTIADNFILGNLTNGNLWSSLTQFGLSVWWFLGMMFGYYYTKVNTEKQMMFFIMLLFVYYCEEFIQVAIQSNSTHEKTTILNLIYRVIVFLPIVAMLQNEKIKKLLFIFISALTVVSMKRGGIIVMVAMLLVYYWAESREKQFTAKRLMTAIGFILIGVVLFGVANAVTNGFLSYRFSIEQLRFGSNRDVKYAVAFDEIVNRDFFSLLVGIGSSKRSGIHNEILEFTYTYGLVGLIMYFALFASMIKRFFSLMSAQSHFASIYGMIVTFIFVVGLFSGVYFTHSTFYIMLALGIVEKKVEEEQNEKNSRNYYIAR